jgi:hypothetical protein
MEKYALNVLESDVLRIFAPKRKEEIGALGKLHK